MAALEKKTISFIQQIKTLEGRNVVLDATVAELQQELTQLRTAKTAVDVGEVFKEELSQINEILEENPDDVQRQIFFGNDQTYESLRVSQDEKEEGSKAALEQKIKEMQIDNVDLLKQRDEKAEQISKLEDEQKTSLNKI